MYPNALLSHITTYLCSTIGTKSLCTWFGLQTVLECMCSILDVNILIEHKYTLYIFTFYSVVYMEITLNVSCCIFHQTCLTQYGLYKECMLALSGDLLG